VERLFRGSWSQPGFFNCALARSSKSNRIVCIVGFNIRTAALIRISIDRTPDVYKCGYDGH
jgi:hypothetical protein